MNMEAKIVTTFIPQLVNAVSVCVLGVADKSLAEGLISLRTHAQIIEATGIEDDKARTLILAVRKSIEVHGDSFQTFLNILDGILPNSTKDVLLPSMRRELEKLSSTKTVPESLFSRYEHAVTQWTYACVEKERLENELKEVFKENEMLRHSMDNSLNQEPSIQYNSQHILESQLATCKKKMDELVNRIEQLKCTIKKQSSIIDLVKSAILSETGKLIDEVKRLVPMREKEITQKLKEWEDKLISYSLSEVSISDSGRKHSSKAELVQLTLNHHPVLLKQLNPYAHKWRDIALHLGFEEPELNSIQEKYDMVSGDYDDDIWLNAMLAEWLTWIPGDSRGSTHPASLEALKLVLTDVGLSMPALYLTVFI